MVRSLEETGLEAGDSTVRFRTVGDVRGHNVADWNGTYSPPQEQRAVLAEHDARCCFTYAPAAFSQVGSGPVLAIALLGHTAKSPTNITLGRQQNAQKLFSQLEKSAQDLQQYQFQA